MSESSDDNDLKRRLKKAVSVTDKLKKKLLFENEVSKELAKRNESLKVELSVQREQYSHLHEILRELDQKVLSMQQYTNRLLHPDCPIELVSLIDEVAGDISKRRMALANHEVPSQPSSSKQRPKSMRTIRPSLHITSSSSGTSLLRRSSIDSIKMDAIPPDIIGDILPDSDATVAGSFTPTRQYLTRKALEVDDRLPDDDRLSSMAHLFEHFIVVGASMEVGCEVAAKMKQVEDTSLSTRFMRTIGGFLSSSGSLKNNAVSLSSVQSKSSRKSVSSDKPADALLGATAKLSYNHQDDPSSSSATESNRLPPVPVSRMSSISSAVISNTAAVVSPSKFILPIFMPGEKRPSKTSIETELSNDEVIATATSSSANIPVSDDHLASTQVSSDRSRSNSLDTSSHPRPSTTSSFTNMIPKSLFTRTSITSSATSAIAITSDTSSLTAATAVEGNQPPEEYCTTSSDIYTASEDTRDSINDGPSSPKDDHKSNDNQSPRTLHYSLHPHLAGVASTEASILYRYPPAVEPPPPEIVDFCLPLGGKLRRLPPKNEDSAVQEILYGHGQSKRSARCFIFTLDDKSATAGYDEESGVTGGRLYGICVIHSRLLDANVSTSMKDGVHAELMEFESNVCFAFITRFPLFNFFFQVIFDIVTSERLARMEALADHSPSNSLSSQESSRHPYLDDKKVYQYIPNRLLDHILESLSMLKPPVYGSSICFQASHGVLPINMLRQCPPIDTPEHFANAAAWALPTLLSCMSTKLLIWSLGLILCEAKVIVIGSEPGLVSCAVLGLLALLRPLEWVAPVIPMLPYKHIDFVESPVPIIAGLVLEYNSPPNNTFDEAMNIIERCNDSEYHNMTMVIDITRSEIILSSIHASTLSACVLPGAQALLDKIESFSSTSLKLVDHHHQHHRSKREVNHSTSATSSTSHHRNHIIYHPTALQQAETDEARLTLSSHISALLAMAQEIDTRMKQRQQVDNTDTGRMAPTPDIAAGVNLRSPGDVMTSSADAPILHFFTSDDEDDMDDEEGDISGDTIEIIEQRKNNNLHLLRQYYSSQNQNHDDAISSTSAVDDINIISSQSSSSKRSSFSNQLLGGTRSASISSMMSINAGNSNASSVSGIFNSIIGANNTTTATTSTSSSIDPSTVISSSSSHTMEDEAASNHNNAMISSNQTSVMCLSKVDFHGDSDKFFKRFLNTQLYSEYQDQNSNADNDDLNTSSNINTSPPIDIHSPGSHVDYSSYHHSSISTNLSDSQSPEMLLPSTSLSPIPDHHINISRRLSVSPVSMDVSGYTSRSGSIGLGVGNNNIIKLSSSSNRPIVGSTVSSL